LGLYQEVLVKHINDAALWELLRALWESIEQDKINETFDRWSSETFANLDSEVKKLTSRMTN
jgi:hypothetical protein